MVRTSDNSDITLGRLPVDWRFAVSVLLSTSNPGWITQYKPVHSSPLLLTTLRLR
jgi:hypothetical protein